MARISPDSLVVFPDGSGLAFLNEIAESVILMSDTIGQDYPEHQSAFLSLISQQDKVGLSELIASLGLANVEYKYS
ncbi:hypothetical protein [Alteromonas gilva]|uniref:Uncharacterized protein n=1 Tax=Alteromonas gilva TaxID=2987522 RepID=A0ABT5L1J7_9ALTE|nr:hypothetical protein [Alteromonas gilva]MDC8830351.1 hypothetical protein [Alteromonas gilva]